MPQGLQVFRADGSVQLDTSTLLGRVVGSILVPEGLASGTISNSQFAYGTPFLVGLFGLGAFTGSVLTGPAFSQISYTVSGNSINWVRTTNQYDTALPSGTLFYGVY